jgi:hypothetical protein
MSRRTAARLAWSMCAVSLASTALAVLLLTRILSQPNPHVFDLWVQGTVIPVTCSTVGVIIASRRPHHPIGWLFCAIGLLAGVNHLCAEYAIYALLTQPGSLPYGRAAAWAASWPWMPTNALLVFVGLLFPDGRLPSRRWLPFAWLNVAVAVVGTLAVAFLAGPIPALDPIENPLGLEGARNVLEPIATVAGALERGILGLIAVASLFLRLRRAGGEEREQIKWLAYAASVVVIGAILTYVVPDATGARWAGRIGLALLAIGFVGIPIAIAVAILRYRLYDVDLVINRTLVYGSLTATLVVLYFGGIVVLQRVFVALTGQRSTLAVVASTLVIAALFNPLRRSIQSFIDRRFYRSRYDAVKTLEIFSARLRDETDLDALSGDLMDVVRQTMQPSHVSLWLRPDKLPKGEQRTSSRLLTERRGRQAKK